MENTLKTNGNISDIIQASMEKVHEMVDTNTVVGDPIVTPDGVTVVPVSRVTVGFGCGGTDYGKNAPKFGGGAGAGAHVEPVAFLVIRDGVTKVVPCTVAPVTVAGRMVEMVPQILDRIENLLSNKEPEIEV